MLHHSAPPPGRDPHSPQGAPLVLTVPGLDNSGPGHWQTLWEQRRADCRRVELGQWERPHRNSWVTRLNLAIEAATRPVVLAAHSLGCLAVAWWARMAADEAGRRVLGALLVAPPEVDFFPFDERIAGFAPTPPGPLPFPSILVASRNDPYIGIHAARQLARRWGSRFVDAGEAGHINARSGLGAWPAGEALLAGLMAQPAPPGVPTAPAAPGQPPGGHLDRRA